MAPAVAPDVTVRQASAGELADCLAVRRRVFIEGQSISEELEVDGLDPQALHFLARRAGAAVGAARLRAVGADAKAERVSVLAEERGRGIGKALMAAVEAAARGAGHARIILSAQAPVVEFYERLGYESDGPIFFEAGIPHRKMWKKL
jgi:predicted GNAT family N-acyltransferase